MVRGRRKAAVKKPMSTVHLGVETPQKDCQLEFEGHLCHSSPPQIEITKFFPTVQSTPAVPLSEPDAQVSPHHKILLETEATVAPTLSNSPSAALSRLSISSKKPLLSPRSNGVSKSRRRLNPSQSHNQQKQKNQDSGSHKLTEYFPVRRSGRRPKHALIEERHRSIEQAILSGCDDGLEVHHFPGKGRGVVAARNFERGEFVVEYAGELIEVSQARVREAQYATDQNTGCYMYYFKHHNMQYCIDATSETDRLGRLVNHSRQGNLQTRTVLVKNKPHLVLVARCEIAAGDEVLYDYGDRSKESLQHHPWLAL